MSLPGAKRQKKVVFMSSRCYVGSIATWAAHAAIIHRPEIIPLFNFFFVGSLTFPSDSICFANFCSFFFAYLL